MLNICLIHFHVSKLIANQEHFSFLRVVFYRKINSADNDATHSDELRSIQEDAVR